MEGMKATEEFKVGTHGIGYIESDLLKRVGIETFEPVQTAPRAIVLPRYMNDSEIESELDPGTCSLGDILSVLDSDNPTFKDGNWNLFYFPACVVSVRWGSIDRSWRVFAWLRDDYDWSVGSRVFSPADHVSRASNTSTLKTSDPLPSELVINGITYIVINGITYKRV